MRINRQDVQHFGLQSYLYCVCFWLLVACVYLWFCCATNCAWFWEIISIPIGCKGSVFCRVLQGNVRFSPVLSFRMAVCYCVIQIFIFDFTFLSLTLSCFLPGKFGCPVLRWKRWKFFPSGGRGENVRARKSTHGGTLFMPWVHGGCIIFFWDWDA